MAGEFVAFIHSARFRDEPAVVQALMAHFCFVTLHPLGDGDGRTHRCIEAVIFVGNRCNTCGLYSLASLFYRNRDEHFLNLLQRDRICKAGLRGERLWPGFKEDDRRRILRQGIWMRSP